MKNRGMKGFVVVLVVGLVAITLLGVDTSRLLSGIVALAIILIALRWIFTGKAPTRNEMLWIMLLFIGPTLLLTLLQISMVKIRTWPNRQALLFLLVIGGALFWLGRKWRR